MGTQSNPAMEGRSSASEKDVNKMHTVTRKDLEARAIDFNNATIQPPPSPEEPPANIGWLGSRSVSNTPILGGRTPVLLSEGGSNENNPLQDSLLDLPENKMSEKSQMTQGIIYGCLNSVLVIPVMIGFASIIYRDHFFKDQLPILTKLVMISACIHQLVFTIFSTLPFSIGQVQDAGLIFPSSMASSIVAQMQDKGKSDDEIISTVLITLSLCTVLLGIALILTGYFKLAAHCIQHRRFVVLRSGSGDWVGVIATYTQVPALSVVARMYGDDQRGVLRDHVCDWQYPVEHARAIRPRPSCGRSRLLARPARLGGSTNQRRRMLGRLESVLDLVARLLTEPVCAASSDPYLVGHVLCGSLLIFT